MIGIPFTIRRAGPDNPVVDEVVYLRTRRSGEAGASMRRAMVDYREATMAQMRQAARTARLADAAGTISDVAALERVERDVAAAMEESNAQGARALAAAETIALLSLYENYDPQEADRIMDQLTERELHAIVATLELGQMPKDFFGPAATQPKPSGTGPSGG